MLQEALDLNVINSSSSFKEIQSLLDDSSQVYKDITKNIPGSERAGKAISNQVKNGMMSKLYIAGDDVWKLYNYRVELDKLTNAFTKHSDKHMHAMFTNVQRCQALTVRDVLVGFAQEQLLDHHRVLPLWRRV